MFQDCAWHFEFNFGLLTIPKCDFIEVEKALFQGLACHFELLFCLLTTPKCDLGEDVKAMFKGLERHSQLIFGEWTCWNAIWWSRKSDVWNGPMSLWTQFRPLDHLKTAAWVISKKRCLMVSDGIFNLLLAFGLAENSILWSRKKQWFKMWNVTLKSHFASWPTEISTFCKSIKRQFKLQNGN